MLVRESIRFISKVNLMSHADFSEKVNGQTKAEADRQTKKTRAETETWNTFTGFTGRYKITHKLCQRYVTFF